MSSPRLIRCINGHVFDGAAHNACPTCGWTEPSKVMGGGTSSAVSSESESSDDSIHLNPNRKSMIIGAAVIAAIAIGIVSYSFLKPAPVPVPVPGPIVKVPDKVAEKTPEKTVNPPSGTVPDKVPNDVTDKPAEKLPEKGKDKVPADAAGTTQNKAAEKVPDKVAEKTPEKTANAPSGTVPDKIPNDVPDKPVEKAPEKTANAPSVTVPNKGAEKTPEKTANASSETGPLKVPNNLPDKPVEKAPEKGTEKVPANSNGTTQDKAAEKVPDKVVEQKRETQAGAQPAPAVPQKAGNLPKFDALEPLTQDVQSAAAAKLGLSAFATETALVTRATTLAEQYPVKLEALRLLVPFVKNNQPQALETAGGAIKAGFDVEANVPIALDYLRRGSDQGATRARIQYAEMLRLGRGVPRDERAAADLYNLVRRSDSKMTEQIVPLLPAFKIKVEDNGPTAWDVDKAYDSSNWELSLKLAHELADVQIAKGYQILGVLSWEGQGVPKDQAVAIGWLKKATTIGYSLASEDLSFVAKSPPSGSGNIAEAMVWLEIAFLQSENRQRALSYTNKISEQSGLLDKEQWAAIKTLFADLPIPGPKY